MPEVVIDRLGPEEGERFREIRLRALRDAPDAFGVTLAEALAFPLHMWDGHLAEAATLVARSGGTGPGVGEDIGLVRLAPDFLDLEAGWLISMWVAPQARGRGVGNMLIDALLELARQDGFERIRLDVADQNQSAVRLYERHGFSPTGDVGTLPPPREHVLEHRRELIL